jgi:hypothetical protein
VRLKYISISSNNADDRRGTWICSARTWIGVSRSYWAL